MGVAVSGMERLAPALVLVKPDTVLACHRRAFRLFWTWKRSIAYRASAEAEVGTRVNQDSPRD
jgi:hypothetical protein